MVSAGAASAWMFVLVTVLLGWLCLLYNHVMGASSLGAAGTVRAATVGAMGPHVDVCVVALCVASLGFLLCQDVVSLLLCFELANVPLVGLLCGAGAGVGERSGAKGGLKGWASAVWLLCG